MATALNNAQHNLLIDCPSGKGRRIGIVVAEWNYDITGKLLDGAVVALKKAEVEESDIVVEMVPGSFELTFAAKRMAQSGNFDSVIVIGCVIQGDTRHFDFVCDSVTQGITSLNLEFDIPFIFCLLTTENQFQAEERAGGSLGNKGEESAVTALKMIDFSCKYK